MPGASAGMTELLRVTQESGARIPWRILLSISWHEGWDNLKAWTGMPTHLFSCGFDFRLGCLGEVRPLTSKARAPRARFSANEEEAS